MQDIIGIILAAGKGTRMRSKLPKALHPICGKPMTRYIIDACKDAGISECIVVIGHGAEQVREGLGGDVSYVVQEEQLGTGDACRRAVDTLGNRFGNVLVLPGDTPLVTADVLKRLISEHSQSEADATVLTAVLEDGAHYGRVVRGSDGSIKRIVEAKDASPEEIKIREINTAIYCFKLACLRTYLQKISPNNKQGEYYLTDVIEFMANDGLRVGGVVSDDPDVVLGVNDRVQLAKLGDVIRRRILERLMLEGVTVVDPSSTYVDWDVEIGQDTILYPGTIIEKGCRIGADCLIGPAARLVNVEVGDRVTILYSTVIESVIDDGTRVGPFANIRPGCKIGKDVRVGDFVEAKNAIIGNSVSMAHLAYVGDAEVGDNTNIGAGTITCNYDGIKKNRTIIGKNAFVGSNVTLIAPVTIGDGAYIAAGSTITKDVPADSLAVARKRQEVKEGWAKRRREKSQKDGNT
ncbi:MAG: bifunctional UDP-N-acetylglucosamine diphosphorylase/glucosamine-1-phosphate N-acetyltransferase GlmU [Armatimonadota bacterium]|nr:bifunctional UDP-N-acetylglucosamine diphosphorylase/glucosamine-1-phosphate N-acetyltransferase GlmU [Armatimonadota bacterium]